MKKRISISFILITCLISLLLTACAKPAPAPAPSPAPAPAPSPAPTPGKVVKPGGTLTINYSRIAGNFGVPLNIKQWDYWYAAHALEGLIELNRKQPGVYSPKLATKWELAPDRSSYTFYLRKDVKFHDGTDFNAQAVKWNLDKVIASKRPELAKVRSIDIIDDYTIRANLSAWDNLVLYSFEGDVGLIISPAAFEKNGEVWCNTHPVGTGPFKIKDYLRNQYVKYEKNRDYWGQVPYLDELVVLHIQDPMTSQAAFLRGEVDILYDPAPSVAAELEAKGTFIVDASSTGPASVIFFNSQDPSSIWSKKKMREALEYAVDKEKIIKSLWLGYAAPVYEIVKGLHDAGGDPGTTPRKFDPQKAKQLIAEAGYTGVKLKLTVTVTPMMDIWVAVQSQLAEAGIQVELNPVAFTTFAQLSLEAPVGNELRNEGQRGDSSMVLAGLQFFDQTSIYGRGVARTAGFQAILDKAVQEEDPAKVMKYMEQLDKLSYEDAMFVPLWAVKLIQIQQPYTKDIILYITPGAKPVPRLQYAWLDK